MGLFAQLTFVSCSSERGETKPSASCPPTSVITSASLGESDAGDTKDASLLTQQQPARGRRQRGGGRIATDNEQRCASTLAPKQKKRSMYLFKLALFLTSQENWKEVKTTHVLCVGVMMGTASGVSVAVRCRFCRLLAVPGMPRAVLIGFVMVAGPGKALEPTERNHRRRGRRSWSRRRRGRRLSPGSGVKQGCLGLLSPVLEGPGTLGVGFKRRLGKSTWLLSV